jgi:hypothetical protein
MIQTQFGPGRRGPGGAASGAGGGHHCSCISTTTNEMIAEFSPLPTGSQESAVLNNHGMLTFLDLEGSHGPGGNKDAFGEPG